MQPFSYYRATQVGDALAVMQREPRAQLIAGGTELVNWLKEGIASPPVLVDINSLPDLDAIEANAAELSIGALARMNDVAAHPEVRRNYPAIAEALHNSASPQLRNMASMGGNLLQRTRCPYFRADVELACNKRRPGSGCAALDGYDRTAAIFGWSEHCVATHPSDVAVAFAALDAAVHVRGLGGVERAIPMTDFYTLPGETPERDTVLQRDELIVRIGVPQSPIARRSRYLKVRERTSYEFALVSVAAGVQLDAGGRITDVRIALGGVAHLPWRLATAERALPGTHLSDATALRAAIEDDFAAARPRRQNGFKIELVERAVVRTLQLAGGNA
ncbi:MAG: xanthine dehydrogenase family protein subunit M [Chloroflexi bacterium]|nr:xanthine dehydrogenase family protein subunit M [Chloroflexota bacterium]MBV9601336.1 xanthine dehydrogenase family protein subunit M [Chloroflexota bacterium]